MGTNGTPRLLVGLLPCIASCAGESAAVTLPLPAAGTLVVRNFTTGDSTDQGVFTVSVGTRTISVPVGGTVTLHGLSVGTYSVSVTGLVINCVELTFPATVTVVADQVTGLSFEVGCVPPVGTLRVANATGGPIIFLFFRMCGSQDWGADRLPSDPVTGTIQPGAGRTFDLHWGCWDLRAQHLASPSAGQLLTKELLGVNLPFDQEIVWSVQ